jgi:hypothetical protein
MAQNKNTTLYVAGGLLIAAAAYFVIRGIALGKKAKEKKLLRQESPLQEQLDKLGGDRVSPQNLGNLIKGGVASAAEDLKNLIRGSETITLTKTTVATKSGTRLRAEPSTSSNVLKTYSEAGYKLNVLSQKKSGSFTWFKVSDGSLVGWVRNDEIIS